MNQFGNRTGLVGSWKKKKKERKKEKKIKIAEADLDQTWYREIPLGMPN